MWKTYPFISSCVAPRKPESAWAVGAAVAIGADALASAATGSTLLAFTSAGMTGVVVDTGVSGPAAACTDRDRAAGRTLCTRWLRSGAAVAGARVTTVLVSIIMVVEVVEGGRAKGANVQAASATVAAAEHLRQIHLRLPRTPVVETARAARRVSGVCGEDRSRPALWEAN
jgi:hypothetical protein